MKSLFEDYYQWAGMEKSSPPMSYWLARGDVLWIDPQLLGKPDSEYCAESQCFFPIIHVPN